MKILSLIAGIAWILATLFHLTGIITFLSYAGMDMEMAATLPILTQFGYAVISAITAAWFFVFYSRSSG